MNESDLRSDVHYLGSSENKAWKNSGLYGIWTHDLCDTGIMSLSAVQIYDLHIFLTVQNDVSLPR